MILHPSVISQWELLKDSSAPLILINAKGQIIRTNDSGMVVLKDKNGSMPLSLHSIFADQSQVTQFIEKVFNDTPDAILECDLKGPQPVSLRLSPLYFKKENNDAYCFLTIQDVSELKQTKARLLISENRFRELIQNSSLGLLEVDDQEVIQYANSSFCTLTGYALDELVGKHAPSLLLPALDPNTRNTMDKVQERRRSGVSDAYELSITGKNGKLLWVLISGAPVYDDYGKVTGSVGIHHDITLQKQEAEVRLRLMQELDQRNSKLEKQQQHLTVIYNFASELLKKNTTAQIFQLLYKTLPGKLGFTDCIVYHFNSARQQLEWDARFTSLPEPFPENLDAEVVVELGKGITGHAAADLTPLWVKDALSDDRCIPDRQFINEPEAGIPVLQGLKTSIRRSEIAVPVVLEGELLAVIDAGNPEPGYFTQMHLETLVTLSNLTAIQMGAINRRNALVESERRLRQVIDSSLDGVFMVDSALVITEINSRAVDLFGYDKDEFIGASISMLFKSEQFSVLEAELSPEADLKWQSEAECLKKDKSEFNAEVTVAVNLIRGRQFYSFFIRDISLAKRSEAELRSALNKEAELNNLKTRFITLTSHEFRTPLTTIQSSAELLSMSLDNMSIPQSDRFNKYINRITGEVARLTNLMNDILVIGRIDAGRVSVKPELIDLTRFISDLIDVGKFLPNDSRAIILKTTGKPAAVEADPSLLGHIFQNLITNALKYSPGLQAPEIHLHFLEDRCTVKVLDFGIGIPAAEQKDLFNTFFRASNVENIQGTGLGLTIIKQFIELHGSEISVESSENIGSCFTFDLYLKLPTHAATYARNKDHTGH